MLIFIKIYRSVWSTKPYTQLFEVDEKIGNQLVALDAELEELRSEEAFLHEIPVETLMVTHNAISINCACNTKDEEDVKSDYKKVFRGKLPDDDYQNYVNFYTSSIKAMGNVDYIKESKTVIEKSLPDQCPECIVNLNKIDGSKICPVCGEEKM